MNTIGGGIECGGTTDPKRDKNQIIRGTRREALLSVGLACF